MKIDGNYAITAKSPIGIQKGILTLKTEGNQLSGSLNNGSDHLTILNGKANGNEYEFTVHIKGPIGMLKIVVKGRVDGDKITGSSKIAFGNITMEGVRQ
ncbi:MAG: hypothetical protein K0S76_1416 [Herbinix sp.]|jgi:hypothetical protein|nr:hypothetical protein [Herbinix sp.]